MVQVKQHFNVRLTTFHDENEFFDTFGHHFLRDKLLAYAAVTSHRQRHHAVNFAMKDFKLHFNHSDVTTVSGQLVTCHEGK